MEINLKGHGHIEDGINLCVGDFNVEKYNALKTEHAVY